MHHAYHIFTWVLTKEFCPHGFTLRHDEADAMLMIHHLFPERCFCLYLYEYS